MIDWLFADPLPVGSLAPDFSASDDQGNLVSLLKLRGKNVVLVFYPANETSGCTAQLCEFRDSWSSIRGRNVEVFGVNPAGAASHASFRKNHRFPFPILVDQGQKVSRLYHASAWVMLKRTVYLIGPDGTIRFARRGMPSPDDVLAAAV